MNRHLQRAHRHRYEDGLLEIMIGMAGVVGGLYFAVAPSFSSSLPEWLAVISVAIVAFVLVAVLRALLLWLRPRITYPRTGYVNIRQPERETNPVKIAVVIVLSMLVGISVGIALLGILVLAHFNPLYVLMGGVFAYWCWYTANQTGLDRFKVLAGVGLLVGALVSISGILSMDGLVLLYGWLGVALFISGLIGLVRYVRHYPLNTEAEAE